MVWSEDLAVYETVVRDWGDAEIATLVALWSAHGADR
jgi:hypothetical protein